MMLMVAIVLCSGSVFAQEYGIVWSQDFENEATYTAGWTTAGSFEYAVLSDGSHMLNINQGGGSGNRAAACSFTDDNFSTATDYRLEFDFGISTSNQNASSMSLTADNTEGILFNITNEKYSESSTIYAPDGTTIIGTITNDKYTKAAPKILSHFLIAVNSEGATLTVTTGGEVVVDSYRLCNSLVHVKGIAATLGRAQTRMAFDNITLSVLGASEKISVPSISITEVDGINRTITIEPGVGSAGTAASATYYTTDASEPNEGNGTSYTAPFEISATSTIKAISYLPDGTASEVATLDVEAGTEVSLGKDIINVTGLTGDGDFLSPVISYVYNKNSVLLSPEVSLTVTFNGEPIELPYTVTESGTISATVTAEGYASATEEYTLAAAYAKNLHEDFTAIAKEDVQEILGDSWTVTEGAGRWAFWYNRTYDIASTSAGGNIDIGGFVRTDNAKNLIIGYGFGRNTANGGNSYWVNNAKGEDIALYEVDESYGNNTNYAKHAVAYVDNNTLKYTTYGPVTLAKVSIYRPVQELLTVTDGEDFTAVGGYNNATYTRTIAEGAYGTICLPFAPDAASLENYTFFKMESAGADAINFVEETTPVANTPYIYCLKGENVAITGGATVVSADINSVEVGNWTMKGSFTKQTIATAGADTKFYGYVADQNKIVKANKTLTVLPYRAYFTAPVNAAAVALRITRGDETTEITAADLDVQPATVIYDLAGRRVEKMEKGIYIVNGKKVIR